MMLNCCTNFLISHQIVITNQIALDNMLERVLKKDWRVQRQTTILRFSNFVTMNTIIHKWHRSNRIETSKRQDRAFNNWLLRNMFNIRVLWNPRTRSTLLKQTNQARIKWVHLIKRIYLTSIYKVAIKTQNNLTITLL